MNTDRIEQIYNELQEQRKTGERKSISYYSGVRMDVSEEIANLLENRGNLEPIIFNKQIHRCNMLMELAEGLKKDVNSQLNNIAMAVQDISREENNNNLLWKEVLRRARIIKKHNINQ